MTFMTSLTYQLVAFFLFLFDYEITEAEVCHIDHCCNYSG
jgi:hypothetical protein